MVALGSLGAAVLIPTGILRLAATGRFADAFRVRDNLELVLKNGGTYVFLVVSLILFEMIADASILLCLVGAIPGTFWGMAAQGAALGHAGAVMGLNANPAAPGPVSRRTDPSDSGG